jgi:hypothetical protein
MVTCRDPEAPLLITSDRAGMFPIDSIRKPQKRAPATVRRRDDDLAGQR